MVTEFWRQRPHTGRMEKPATKSGRAPAEGESAKYSERRRLSHREDSCFEKEWLWESNADDL